MYINDKFYDLTFKLARTKHLQGSTLESPCINSNPQVTETFKSFFPSLLVYMQSKCKHVRFVVNFLIIVAAHPLDLNTKHM